MVAVACLNRQTSPGCGSPSNRRRKIGQLTQQRLVQHVKLLGMIVITAGTLTGMASASAIDTNEGNDQALSWRRCSDRNLIDANRDQALLA
jgi:hypothetical protein